MPIQVLNHISPTSLASFSDCRLQWYWSGPMGYRRVERQMAFDLGIGVHEALAEFYRAQMQGKTLDPVKYFTRWADFQIAHLPDEATDEDLTTLVEVRTLGIAMLEGYVEEYQEDQFEILAVEEEVRRPLPETDWFIQVRIDTLVRDYKKRRRVFVLEHKTFGTLNEGYLEKDNQFALEAWCAEKLVDEEVAGVIWNGLRKQIPSARTKNPMFERRHLYINEHQIAMVHKRAHDMWRTIVRSTSRAMSASRCTRSKPGSEMSVSRPHTSNHG